MGLPVRGRECWLEEALEEALEERGKHEAPELATVAILQHLRARSPMIGALNSGGRNARAD
jgi:hypothetical protein